MKTLLDIPLDSICAKQRNAHELTNLYEYTTQNTKKKNQKKKPLHFLFFWSGAFYPSQFITKRSEWKNTKRKGTWGQELVQKARRNAAS